MVEVEITNDCFRFNYLSNIIIDTSHVQYFAYCEIKVIEIV